MSKDSANAGRLGSHSGHQKESTVAEPEIKTPRDQPGARLML